MSARKVARPCAVPRTVVCWADMHEDCRGLRCGCRCHQPARTVPLTYFPAADLIAPEEPA